MLSPCVCPSLFFFTFCHSVQTDICALVHFFFFFTDAPTTCRAMFKIIEVFAESPAQRLKRSRQTAFLQIARPYPAQLKTECTVTSTKPLPDSSLSTVLMGANSMTSLCAWRACSALFVVAAWILGCWCPFNNRFYLHYIILLDLCRKAVKTI